MATVYHQKESHQNLVLQFLRKFASIDAALAENLEPYFEYRTFPRRSMIIQKGEIENYISLVSKGLIRKFVVAGKKEITLQLATEGHMIHSEISFLLQQPSEVFVESIEPSMLISISYPNVQKILEEMPEAEFIARSLLSYMFLKKDARYYNQLVKNTRQRFIEYMEQHPHMLQRVPQKILASYLNIKPETFSRLKHLMLKK